jgi:Zn-dependent peptidase ImmA (M78 family)
MLPGAARDKAFRAARQVRDRLGVGNETRIPDLLQLIEDRASVPVFLEPLPDGMFGAYRRRDEGGFILISSLPALVRQRFTLAHEFGHHELGHGSVVDTSETLADYDREPMEVQANYFASEFLAPVRAIQNWMAAHNDPDPDLEVVVTLACEFGISAQAARIRLEAARYVTTHAKRRALDALIGEGEHKTLTRRLGLGDLVDELWRVQHDVPRKPGKLEAKALEAYEEGFIDLKRTSDILEVTPAKLRDTLTARGITPHEDEDPDFSTDLS